MLNAGKPPADSWAQCACPHIIVGIKGVQRYLYATQELHFDECLVCESALEALSDPAFQTRIRMLTLQVHEDNYDTTSLLLCFKWPNLEALNYRLCGDFKRHMLKSFASHVASHLDVRSLTLDCSGCKESASMFLDLIAGHMGEGCHKLQRMEELISDYDNESMCALASGLAKGCAGLHYARFAYKQLDSESVANLTFSIAAGCHDLKWLDISWNPMQDAGIQALATNIASACHNLEGLLVAGCEFTDVGVEELGSNLAAGCPMLTTLNVSGNSMGDVGVEALGRSLASGCHKLVKLDVSCNKINDKYSIGDKGAEKLVRHLAAGCPELATLHLNGMTPGSVGSVSLARILADGCRSMQDLILDNCKDKASAVEVAHCLASACADLSQLGLGHEDENDEGDNGDAISDEVKDEAQEKATEEVRAALGLLGNSCEVRLWI